MRSAAIIILLSIGQICWAQLPKDTTISKEVLDSIRLENYKIKNSLKVSVYHNRLQSNLRLIDTTQQGTDSIIINYISKEKLLLKRLIKRYNEKRCQTAETEEFFNEKGLLEYLEYWSCNCRLQVDYAEEEKYFQKLLERRERFVYDSIGKITASFIIYYGSTKPGPGKYEYHYDSNGKANIQRKRIAAYEFWD